MNIGPRLKEARQAVGYTLKKAYELSGIRDTSICEFEKSKREPKFSQLSILADVYKRPIEFFLADAPLTKNVMLWREQPHLEEVKRETEAEFRQLCERYHRLEVLTDQVRESKFPEPDVSESKKFDYLQAELFAGKVKKEFALGNVPIASLKRILEESYYVKIFYLNFPGSSISTVSEEFGSAILLNKRNKQWRRSYDLAHELFHILTWQIFRPESADSFTAGEKEEKLANAFASRLLMPKEAIIRRIRANLNSQQEITFDRLDDIAREYDVSLDALICRIANIFGFKKEQTEKCRSDAENYIKFSKPRESYEPAILPERYCDLAQHSLREGKMSLIQFAKYMGISYKKAQEYLTEDEDFKDEKISIPVAWCRADYQTFRIRYLG